MPQGNGDTSLVHFGREITPNHHKLAETFVLMDNYYCSGVLSADGHQWTNEAFVTDYLESRLAVLPAVILTTGMMRWLMPARFYLGQCFKKRIDFS